MSLPPVIWASSGFRPCKKKKFRFQPCNLRIFRFRPWCWRGMLSGALTVHIWLCGTLTV